AIAGLAIDDVEANAFAGRRGRKQRHRARHQRKLEITFPVGTRRHDATLAPTPSPSKANAAGAPEVPRRAMPDWVSLPLNLFRRSSRLLLRLIVRGAVPSRNEPAICYGNAMPVRMRADRLLVERGLFESRAQAQAAIAAGLVTANDLPVVRPSQEI